MSIASLGSLATTAPLSTAQVDFLDPSAVKSREELNNIVEGILQAHNSVFLDVVVRTTTSNNNNQQQQQDQQQQFLPQMLQSLNPSDRWIKDISPFYVVYKRLGKGASGMVAAARPVSNNNNNSSGEHVAIKAIDRSELLKNGMRVKHLAVELAVLSLEPPHPNVNHRLSGELYHTKTHILIPLDYVTSPTRSTVLCSLAHCLSYRKPSRLPLIDDIYERWKKSAKVDGGISDPEQDQEQFHHFLHQTDAFRKLANELNFTIRDPPQVPQSGGCSLFELIVGYKRLSEPMVRVLARQLFLGLKYLKEKHIVSRDIKTENIIVAIDRSCVLKRDSESGKVNGVTFNERIRLVICDFGLAKCMVNPNTSRDTESGELSNASFASTVNNNSITASCSAAAAVVGNNDNDNNAQNNNDNNNNNNNIPFPAIASAGNESNSSNYDVFSSAKADTAIAVQLSPTTGSSPRFQLLGGGGNNNNTDNNNSNNNNLMKQNNKDHSNSSEKSQNEGGLQVNNESFPKATSSPTFNIVSTKCGTEQYSPLEMINACLRRANSISSHNNNSLDNNNKNSTTTTTTTTASVLNTNNNTNNNASLSPEKWITNNKSLYKLDTYCAGTAIFCCLVGSPPYRVPKSYRPVAREERMRQLEILIQKGASFPQCVSFPAKTFTAKLLENDVSRRYTTRLALDDPFLRDAKDALITEVSTTGVQNITMYDSNIYNYLYHPNNKNHGNNNENDDSSALAQGMKRIVSEGAGSSSSTSDREETAADAATTEKKKKKKQSNVVAVAAATDEGENKTSNNNQEENKDGDDEDESDDDDDDMKNDSEMLSVVRELARKKEDGAKDASAREN